MFSILHIGKYYFPHRGGIETHLRGLASRQVTTNPVRAIVANSSAHDEETVIDGVDVRRVARIATIASMPVCPGLTKAIRDSPADLVHIQMPNPGAAFSFLRSGHRGKLVLTHQSDTIGRQILRRLSDPVVFRLMQRADRILVTSARYLESSPELHPFRRKCAIIPLGIDVPPSTCGNPEASEALRDRFGNRIILAIGRLVPYKGFDVLVRAMKLVNAHLLLIGGGPQMGSLTALIEKEQLASKITIVGQVAALEQYFEAATLFVLPSVTRAEAYGLVQLEAMAAGLPVVNTDIESAVPELSVNGQTGLTVPPGDVNALAAAMNYLLERPALCKQFGEAARAKVEAEFTADLMTNRIMSVYREVLAEPNR
jgi:rhamnosyl/mannosyltransferase